MKLWRTLIKSSPAGNDDRLAASYVLMRLGQLAPEDAQGVRQEILHEDRYGYFGYRVRWGFPSPVSDRLPPLSECPSPPGSHAAKAKKLLLVGFPAEAVAELRMASALQKDLRTDWAMAQAQMEMGDHAGAIRSVRRVYQRAYNESGDEIRRPRGASSIRSPSPRTSALRPVRNRSRTFSSPPSSGRRASGTSRPSPARGHWGSCS